MINRSLAASGTRKIDIELLGLDGLVLHKSSVDGITTPNTSKKLAAVPGIDKIKNVALLRLILSNSQTNTVLSTNTYWLSSIPDVLDWENSTWYNTPLTSYADFTAIGKMESASVHVTAGSGEVVLENKSKVPAVFIRLGLVDEKGNDVLPVTWTDNYITLWPGERVEVGVEYGGENKRARVQFEGRNVKAGSVSVGGGGY